MARKSYREENDDVARLRKYQKKGFKGLFQGLKELAERGKEKPRRSDSQ